MQINVLMCFSSPCEQNRVHSHLHAGAHGESCVQRLLYGEVHLPQRPVELAGRRGRHHTVGISLTHTRTPPDQMD